MKVTRCFCDICGDSIGRDYIRMKIPKFYNRAIIPNLDGITVEKKFRMDFDMCEDCFEKFTNLLRKELRDREND